MDQRADFIEDTWGSRKISINPRCMWGNRKVNRGKEIGTKATMLGILPSKSILVNAHKFVHKCTFFGPEKTFGM
jgi:hypothetical protein